MGIYSTKLAVDEAAEEKEKFMEELDEAVAHPDFMNVLEASFLIHENDKMLFDAMIEADFMSAYNESTGVVLEAEDEKKSNKIKLDSIWKNIQKVIGTIKSAIVGAWGKLVRIVDDKIIKPTKEFIGKIEAKITVENLKDFDGLKNFAFPNKGFIEDSNKNIKNLEDILKKYENKMTIPYFTADAMEETYDLLKDKLEEYEKSILYSNEFGGFLDKEATFKPSQDQINEALAAMKDSRSTLKGLKNNIAVINGLISKMEASAKKVMKSKNEDEFAVRVANKQYSVVSAMSRTISKTLNKNIAITKQQIAAYRKLVLVCGAAANRAANKKEAQHESSLWFIGEASDMYVEECFEF